jgi:hypothetical protein
MRARPTTHHLVVLHPEYLDLVLDGRKTIECRLSRRPIPPFRVVRVRDVLWLKESNGPIRGVALVTKARFASCENGLDLDRWRAAYEDRVLAGPAFWRRARGARFGSLIWLRGVCPLEPFTVRKSDRRAWVVLSEPPHPGARIVTLHRMPPTLTPPGSPRT